MDDEIQLQKARVTRMLKAAAKEYEWELDFGDIAYLWREGCIIRSALLEHIKQAFAHDPGFYLKAVPPSGSVRQDPTRVAQVPGADRGTTLFQSERA